MTGHFGLASMNFPRVYRPSSYQPAPTLSREAKCALTRLRRPAHRRAGNGRSALPLIRRATSGNFCLLKYAIVFLVISLIAGALGMTSVSRIAKRISLILFALFFLGFLALV